MNRMIRIRRFNPSSKFHQPFDIMFPQTVSHNVLRSEDGGVLESYLTQYDRHLADRRPHFNRAVSYGTGRNLCVDLHKVVLVDNLPLLITLHTDLECDPTLSFNGGEAFPIVSANGSRIPGGQVEGCIIFVVWSALRHEWILMSTSEFSDVTRVALPVLSDYTHVAQTDGESVIVVPGFNRYSDALKINYGQKILRRGIDYEYVYEATDAIRLLEFGLDKGDTLYFEITKYIVTSKRGNIKYILQDVDRAVTMTEDGTTHIVLPAEAKDSHSIEVNYEQTVLRNGIDYDFDDLRTSIDLKTFSLDAGEVINFTITKFVEINGEVIPNNSGATGNYRYKMKVLHVSYTAEEDKIAVIPVPEYHYRKDDIAVIRDNHLGVLNVDYAIDEIGNVVLLGAPLNTGESIYFTILQGAMLDVPDFNTVKATGHSGQHIHLDISYDILHDFYVLLVQLRHDLLTAPTAKCIDGPAEPILDCFGNPVLGGYKAGSYMWLVYNYDKHTWYSLSHSQIDISTLVPTYLTASGEANFTGRKLDENGVYMETVIEHGLGMKPETLDVVPCEPPTIREDGKLAVIGDVWVHADEEFLYVGNTGDSTSKFRWSVSTEDATNDLRSYLENELEAIKSQPGKIITSPYVYTAPEDNVTEIFGIPDFTPGVDKLIVNYGQTVLRESIDFEVSKKKAGIRLINGMMLDRDDIVQFIIIKQDTELTSSTKGDQWRLDPVS